MSLTSTQGVIVLSGNVDGVAFAALRNKVVSHGHALAGNVENTTENITIDDTDDFEVAESSSPGIADVRVERAQANPSTRTHNHTVGTLAEDGTNNSAGVAPSGSETTLNGTNGNVECRTVDGYAPEDIWARHKDHNHDLTGSTGSTTPSALSICGVSGTSWNYFRIASDSSGTGAVYERVDTATAAHNHGIGAIATRLKLANLGAGTAPTAAGSEAKLDGANGHVITNGNVNGVDISAFKTKFDSAAAGNHRHIGTGTSAQGGSTTSQLRGISSGKTYFSDGAGTWRQVTVSASPGSAHTHDGGSNMNNSNVT